MNTKVALINKYYERSSTNWSTARDGTISGVENEGIQVKIDRTTTRPAVNTITRTVSTFDVSDIDAIMNPFIQFNVTLHNALNNTFKLFIGSNNMSSSNYIDIGSISASSDEHTDSSTMIFNLNQDVIDIITSSGQLHVWLIGYADYTNTLPPPSITPSSFITSSINPLLIYDIPTTGYDNVINGVSVYSDVNGVSVEDIDNIIGVG